MKKVIILCSALVFDFLTYSDASAVVNISSVTHKNSASALEDILTELIEAAGPGQAKSELDNGINIIKKLNEGPKLVWDGDLKLQIKNGKVQFVDKAHNKCAPKRVDTFKKALKQIQGRINQLKAQRAAQRQQQAEALRPQENGAHPEPANLIPWASQTPRNIQNNTEQSQIEGRTSVDQRQHGDVDQFSALQRRNNVPEIEGRTSVDQRQHGDVDRFSALQRRNNAPEIEGRTSVDQRQHGDVDRFSALQRRNNAPEIEGRTSVDQRQHGDVDRFSALQRRNNAPEIEGRTSVDQRQHGDVDRFSALQRRNNVPEIEGRTSVDPRQPGDVDQFSASQRRNNVPEIEGDNQRRAPDSGDSEVNNSGNQNGWVNRETSDRKVDNYAPIEDQEAWLNGEALRRNIENGSNAIDYAPPIQDYNLGGNSATIGGGGVPTLPGK